MRGSSLPPRVAVIAALVLTAAAGALSAQERVGVNAAVNPDASGTPPGGAPRRLVIGQDVVFNEHITTAADGQTQLLFVDESSLTIAPNSDVTIDEFVYDRPTGTGKLTMTVTSGLLRYVGGKLSKLDNAVKLDTPTATLAVRGGAFITQIDPDGETEAAFLYGKGLTVTSSTGASETLIRPGFAVFVSGLGVAPSIPAPVPPGLLARFTQALDGQAGKTGGAKTVPSNVTVASSGISQTVSGNLTASVQQATQAQGAIQATPQVTATPTTTTSTLQSTSTQGAQQQTVTSSIPPISSPPGMPTIPPPVTVPPPVVIGMATPVFQLNALAAQMAIGTYSGSATGSVVNNSASYTATGGFTGTYNFGTQNGTLTISNFDGHTLSTTGHIPLNGANYSSNITQSGFAGTLSGTFFGSTAATTGGNFAFHATTGPTYIANGTFTGAR